MNFFMKVNSTKSTLAVKRNLKYALLKRGKSQNTENNNVNVNHEAYCMKLVRQRDWEGYISILLLPKPARKSAFAIKAFNTEVALVGGNVTESSIGNMRLQFWRNVLEGVYDGNPVDSPVAQLLYDAVLKHNISKSWLKRMIKAREDHMSDPGFRNIRELEDYADDTATSQLCLILQCLGINDMNADHTASHIGKAQGIITMIRSIPHHANRRKVLLPIDFLIKHSVSQEDIVRGSQEQNMIDLTFDLASQAHVHLGHGRKMGKEIPVHARKAFLITSSLDWYLRQLQRVDFNVFHPKLQQRNDGLPFSVFMQSLLRKI